MLRALAQAVSGAIRTRLDLAGSREDLTGYQKRNQPFHEAGEGRVARDEVVLVTAVRVPGRVRVVLERPNPSLDTVFRQPVVGAAHELVDDSLPCTVIGDEIEEVVALRRGVLRVESGVDVHSGAILQEDVRILRARDDLLEQIAGEHLGRQDGVASAGARDAILALETEDAALHLVTSK